MIYILTEEILNGTVTMDIVIKGIEAECFEDAKSEFKKRFGDKIEIYREDDEYLSYSVPQNGIFKVEGRMKNKALELI